ncbi:PH domain-containing protein [Planctomycetota bacterium]
MRTIINKHQTKPCPYCAEPIRLAAVKCRFCGEFLRGDRSHSCPEPEEWNEAESEEEYEYEEVDEEEMPEEDEEEEYEEEEEEEEIDDEDEVLYAGRPSIFARIGTILVGLVLITLCGAVYYQPLAHYLLRIPQVSITQAHVVTIENWLDLGALSLAIGMGLYVLYQVADLKSIYYEVTPDRIEWSRGIFSRKVDNVDMFRVIDLKLRRSLLDCLVGIGTVHLTTKDDSDPTFDFIKVRYCRDLYNIIKKAGLEADKQRGVIHLE